MGRMTLELTLDVCPTSSPGGRTPSSPNSPNGPLHGSQCADIRAPLLRGRRRRRRASQGASGAQI
eukprot:11723865-Alexandrium_andersonii.AAC.1